MSLYEIAEDAYLARAGNVSTNGIGAAVDAVLEALRDKVEILPDAHRRKSKMGGAGYGEWGGDGSIWRTHVLGLLKGDR